MYASRNGIEHIVITDANNIFCLPFHLNMNTSNAPIATPKTKENTK